MIDHVTKVIPGKLSEGYKLLDENIGSSKFTGKMIQICQGCYNSKPLVQMASISIFTLDGNKGKTAYLTNINNAKFIKKFYLERNSN